MKILVTYATSEGHTRKIARWIADRVYALDQSVELLSLLDAKDIDLDRYDGVMPITTIQVGALCSETDSRLAQAYVWFCCIVVDRGRYLRPVPSRFHTWRLRCP